MSKEKHISHFTSTHKHHLHGTKYIYFVTNDVDRKNDNSMVGTKTINKEVQEINNKDELPQN